MNNLRKRLKIKYSDVHFGSWNQGFDTMNEERQAASELIDTLVSTLEHIREDPSYPAYMCRVLANNTLKEIK